MAGTSLPSSPAPIPNLRDPEGGGASQGWVCRQSRGRRGRDGLAEWGLPRSRGQTGDGVHVLGQGGCGVWGRPGLWSQVGLASPAPEGGEALGSGLGSGVAGGLEVRFLSRLGGRAE